MATFMIGRSVVAVTEKKSTSRVLTGVSVMKARKPICPSQTVRALATIASIRGNATSAGRKSGATGGVEGSASSSTIALAIPAG